MNLVPNVVVLVVLTTASAYNTPLCTCKDNKCHALHRLSAGLQASRDTCKEWKGELMTFPSEEAYDALGLLLDNDTGEFWVGLRPLQGDSSDGRGYPWSSGPQTTELTNITEEESVLSPRCVSVSRDRKLIEKQCDDELTGFFCEGIEPNFCEYIKHTENLGTVFHDDGDCFLHQCEHFCVPVLPHGFVCLCQSGFVPEKYNCVLVNFCQTETCPARCSDTCKCPNGYVLNDTECVDIDECSTNYCDQLCINTPGGFVCACDEGFELEDPHKCMKTVVPATTPSAHAFITPAVNHTVTRASHGAPGHMFWVITLVAVMVFGIILLVRYLRRRTKEEQTNQTNVEIDCEA